MSWMRSCTWPRRAASGRCCRTTSLRRPRSKRYFYDWRSNGLLESVNHHLVMPARELEGREAGPSAGVIDSQSVKTTESGGVRGYDACKKIKGRKVTRHRYTGLGLIVHGRPGPRRRARGPLDPSSLPTAASPLRRPPTRDRNSRAPKDIGRWKLEIIAAQNRPCFELMP